MKIIPEMMAKLKTCKSADAVLEVAKQEKISLTMEQAEKAFALLKSEDISDEEMNKIIGGMVVSTLSGPLVRCYPPRKK